MKKKIPVKGFLITCLACGSHHIKIETRQDGTDFQCLDCGNKLIIRPGEIFSLQIPKNVLDKKIKKESEDFKKKLDNTPLDDWPKDVLNKYIEKNKDKFEN